MHFNPKDIIHSTAPGGNRAPGFQRWELPPRTEGITFTTSENVARVRASHSAQANPQARVAFCHASWRVLSLMVARIVTNSGNLHAVTKSSGYSRLNSGKVHWYKHPMCAMGEPGREDLPRVISAEELQTMLGTSETFCSWDASKSAVSELMARWPFLLSCPLMGTNKKPTQ